MPHAARPAALLTLAALALTPAVAPAESFTSNGFEIHYDVLGQGAGDTVVLIHGYLGSAADWATSPVTARLAETHRVVAIDVRGHGHSDRSANPDDHGDEAVTDVVRLLDHLHVDRADVVGYSMGGCIALRLAVLHPDRVDEVVVGGASSTTTSTRSSTPRSPASPPTCAPGAGSSASSSSSPSPRASPPRPPRSSTR
ncbi:MAG: alpha/beta hydrolase [Phycisphaerales bacterium]